MPAIFCILILLLLLCFPELCVRGAADGLSLWLFTLVPAFFPFLFLSGLMVSCGAAEQISRFCARIFCPLFHVSAAGAYVLFMGFLSGYPMGAKLSAEFVKTGRISPEEGNFLLTCSNNPSPMFLVGFVLSDCMREPYSKIGAMAMFYAAPVITGLLLSMPLARRNSQARIAADAKSVRITAVKETTGMPVSSAVTGTANVPGNKTSDSTSGAAAPLHRNLIRHAMTDAFETLVYLGGYVILFHIGSALILALAGHFPADVFPVFCVLAASLEMSGGTAYLASSGMPADLVNLLISLCVISGGVCITAQTAGLLSGSGLSVRPYIRGKMIQLAIAAGIYFLVVIR